jgi:ABC-type hemin transport system substrate-binding protein
MKPIRFFLTFVAVLILTVGPVDAGTGIPERVVSLSPIVTETIFLINAQDRLIADTTYCNTPEAAAQQMTAEARKEVVGLYAKVRDLPKLKRKNGWDSSI